MLQFGASITDGASSVNYNCNMFITQATGYVVQNRNISQVKIETKNDLAYCTKAKFLTGKKFTSQAHVERMSYLPTHFYGCKKFHCTGHGQTNARKQLTS